VAHHIGGNGPDPRDARKLYRTACVEIASSNTSNELRLPRVIDISPRHCQQNTPSTLKWRFAPSTAYSAVLP